MGMSAEHPMEIGWGRLRKAPCSINLGDTLLGRMAARPAAGLDQLDRRDRLGPHDRHGLQDPRDPPGLQDRPSLREAGPAWRSQMLSR